MFARHKSTINIVIFIFVFFVLSLGNLHFKGCINIKHMVRKHCFSLTDDSDKRYCVAQFLLARRVA